MAKHLLPDALFADATWPADAQAKLASFGEVVEAVLNATAYHPTESELAGIDRGLADANAGRFATAKQVAAVFARHRRA